jgi:DNA primase
VISQELKDRIREASDIVAVISKYVSLKPAGKTLKGLCPFHQEKTPSFVVNPDKQFYHCFGCGVGGDIFEFLMRKEGLSFMEALKDLAQRASIALPEDGDGQPSESDRLRRQLFQVMAWAAERFTFALKLDKAGKPGQAYLKERGVSPEVAERFGLGFAPTGWQNMIRAGQRDHFSEELLEQAGLVVRKESGQGAYDRFRERVMFPIQDVQGRIMAFGGRLIKPGEPKYLNSPETQLFHKGEGLYALHLARESCQKQGRLILVEGYMDVIACHTAGVLETVASLGTALTASQVQLIKRYVPQVLLMYDMDEAGIKAALRAFEILNQQELSVKALSLDGAKDPDEFIRKRGAKAFQAHLAQAVRMPEFVLKAAERRYDLQTTDGKIAIKNQVLPVIARLREGIERQEGCRLLAEHLRQPERLIMQELAKALPQKQLAEPLPFVAEPAILAKPSPEEEILLSSLLRFPEELIRHRETLAPADFQDARLRRLLEQMLLAPPPDSEDLEKWFPDFMGRLEDPELTGLASGLAAMDRGEENSEWVVRDCLNRLRKNRLEQELTEIQIRINEVQREGDMETFKHLAHKKQELASQLRQLGVLWKSS